MCAQCTATGAVAATAAATGARVWIGAVAPRWFHGAVKRWISGAVVVGGVVSAALIA